MKKLAVLIFAITALFYAGCIKLKPVVLGSWSNLLALQIDSVQKSCTQIKVTAPSAGSPDSVITISADFEGGSFAVKLNESRAILTGAYAFENNKLRHATSSTLSPKTVYVAGITSLNMPVAGSGSIEIFEITPEKVVGNFQFVTAVDTITRVSKTVTSSFFELKRG